MIATDHLAGGSMAGADCTLPVDAAILLGSSWLARRSRDWGESLAPSTQALPPLANTWSCLYLYVVTW